MQLDGRMFTSLVRRARMIKRDKLSLLPFMLVLFTLSFLLRVRSIHMDVFGDETLYYYLSKTLGIAPASTKDLPPLWTHFSVRPFLYLFFFPWAQLGFIPFRLVNILVGCTVPCLIFALSTRMRASAYLAMCFALLASLHPQLIFHSVVAFPDMLATALLLGGLLAYFSDSTRWATLLFCLSVLTKEAFAMFLVPLLVDGSIRRCKAREKLVIAPMVGLAVVAITNGFEVYVLHGALQGWSSRRIGDDFYWAFFWSCWFIPFALLLLLHKEYRVFAISLGAPAFFYVWDHVMKKGADAWYVIGPFSVAMFVVTVAVQKALDTLKTSASPLPEEAPAPPLWLRIPKPLCSAAILLILIVAPQGSGWRTIHVEDSLAQLGEPWLKAGSGNIARAAAALKKMKPQNLLVMDAFWGCSYYPFGLLARHVDSMCTEDNYHCITNESQLRNALGRHTDIIWANKNLPRELTFRHLLKDCLVYKNREFTIYRLNAACRKQLE